MIALHPRRSTMLGLAMSLGLACCLAGPLAAAEDPPDPVIDRDFPDPDTLVTKGAIFVFGTNGGGTDVRAARSDGRDLGRWEPLPDALAELPTWAREGRTWAPEVAARADGDGYVMYVTAHHAESGRQCIGTALSDTPEGPFTPVGTTPLVCQLDEGGSIDPSTFTDIDGRFYLLWKNDGNCCGQDTWIYIQELSADGLTLLGDHPARLIRQDLPWEGELVEAPTLWRQDGGYHLFYSANAYSAAAYAIGHAVASSPYGPYAKDEAPLLATTSVPRRLIGPGGQDVLATADGQTWLVYHSWYPGPEWYRAVNIDRLDWDRGEPVVRLDR